MRKITTIFTIALVAIIAIYDVCAIVKGGVESSISHMMIEWSYKFPAFPFLVGFTCGHLFWRMKDTPITKEIADSLEEKK